MNDYSKIAGRLKAELVSFAKKISQGLGRPRFKLMADMLVGISHANSCKLTEIGRTLQEKILLKKTVERLSDGLGDMDEEDMKALQENYRGLIKDEIDSSTVFVIDNSDVAKPKSVAMESLALVYDGSTEQIVPGYMTLEIAAVTAKHKTPISVYDRVFSAAEPEFDSQTAQTLAGLKYLSKYYGKKGIRTLDRGYDANVFFEYFIERHEAFIIRVCKTRNVIHKGKTQNIMEVAGHYKGKYAMKYRRRNGKTAHCKIARIPIKLPKFQDCELTLIVVFGIGQEPMLLLSNLTQNDERLATTIAKVYLMRWQIEEYFRFKKQQYKFEGFRVRNLNAIRALHRIVTMLAGFIALKSRAYYSLLTYELIYISKRVETYGLYKKPPNKTFLFYAIADGIRIVLQQTRTGIRNLVSPLKKPLSAQIMFPGI